ncbi:deoxynucleoside kinase [Nitrosomonas sp. Nm33]|uniref:deoxynucleoside kinase n=1 Tax=Nitrosomonas sp. Nm33 TaxID=133724 RepID=UPI000898665C|nr:deoxynucleoside kinase [Nitrosomonas sp. Nm33]SDY36184.1 deoxyguanosine kinase/deoxyadenosine/deoxycytidine kinase [Nitrosomonas sp. Nm33]
MTCRIEICGGIASGKTTLANLLASLNIKPILENFQINPFWKAFYADPIGTAFETEITFLLQHYHQIKLAGKSESKIVSDFAMYLDLAYAHVTLQEDKRETFLSVYREVEKELGVPALLIHLKCDPETELKRIRERGRDVENLITIEYLQQINTQLEKILIEKANPHKLFVINSGLLDFAHDEDVKQSVLNKINTSFSLELPRHTKTCV